MERAKQIALLEELQGLKDNGLFFLDDEVAKSPITRYASQDRFDAEMRDIFRGVPIIACHASELPEPGSFMTRELSGLPVLLTRDRDNTVHAFINVCRHRGARLVREGSGCKNAFSCPYHAWTWGNNGTLRGVPHQKEGFPGLDRDAHALKRLPATERYGLVWVVANTDAQPDFDSFLTPLAGEFAWAEMETLAIAATDTIERKANWKLLAEGGIEAYHFKVTHRDTIGPHFLDNLSSYETLGSHMRSVLPRSSLPELNGTDPAQWDIRTEANVLYTVFPTSQFLVMQDHIGWIELIPLAPDLTRLRLTTLAPKSEITPDKEEHWKRNHAITSVTLNEDFEVNEEVQSGLLSGANESLTFGRYEGALDAFNREIERHLTPGAA
ncbi:Rieske 2Fe-2S domain-containing protein [Shimia sp. CNT1-13L.2]|uniref:aromatic ring-hydroxylating oxygenase subunit alpha n=1 Tax=Shimia sp. CNT1-13L.2 TaxID=2959663 RepID=UPI0020CCB694|nr:SRPBCC family protein [Shimia sp. CNT1-13L.2]MCP9483665.1 Rieske 2Fe-2S domain-containing protein [Shimia sp. CNT1-13L.2]